MKMNTLQMRRAAMPVLFVLLLSVAGVTNSLAQNQVATLQHDGEISAFYGGNAFIDAYNAADTSDVITLSGGNFTCPSTISKPITIRGAGVLSDSVSMTEATVLKRPSVAIFIKGGSSVEHLTVEGVDFSALSTLYYSNLYYAEFVKCRFGHFNHITSENNVSSGIRFTNCRLFSFDFGRATDVVFINSIIQEARTLNHSQSTNKNMMAYNSIIGLQASVTPKYSDFTNCIINAFENTIPDVSCSLANCLCITNGYGSLLQNALHSNCMEVETLDEVFVDFTDNIYDPFILKDEIANSIVGTDGTQVGIHGGMYPYSDHPYYMTMKRCNVGSRTTDDGHLSVDIEVVTE